MNNQSTLYIKSYDLNIKIAKALLKMPRDKWGTSIEDFSRSLTLLGTTAYMAEQIAAKGSLLFRLYTMRKACYKAMFIGQILQEVKILDNKFMVDVQEDLLQILKMLSASISTIKKNKLKIKEDL